MLHLSGEMPSVDCWKADTSLQDYVKNNKIDFERLHILFYEKLFQALKPLNNTIFIVNSDVVNEHIALPDNIIVHYTINDNN